MLPNFDGKISDACGLHDNFWQEFGMCQSHDYLEKKTVKSVITTHATIVSFKTLIIMHRQFLINIKMATVVLHLAKSHKIREIFLLTE